jgi:ribosomal protein S3
MTCRSAALISDKLGSRAAINKVDIERSPNLVTVTIATAKAGVVIGRGGQGAQELKAAIEKIYGYLSVSTSKKSRSPSCTPSWSPRTSPTSWSAA